MSGLNAVQSGSIGPPKNMLNINFVKLFFKKMTVLIVFSSLIRSSLELYRDQILKGNLQSHFWSKNEIFGFSHLCAPFGLFSLEKVRNYPKNVLPMTNMLWEINNI